MGSHNPGRFRKEGREAFEPHCDPEDFNPYNKKTFWGRSNYENWLEGWQEAQAEYMIAPEEEEEEDYMVAVTYPDEIGQEEAGYITLRTIKSCHDMPIELEIDGVVYKPQF